MKSRRTVASSDRGGELERTGHTDAWRSGYPQWAEVRKKRKPQEVTAAKKKTKEMKGRRRDLNQGLRRTWVEIDRARAPPWSHRHTWPTHQPNPLRQIEVCKREGKVCSVLGVRCSNAKFQRCKSTATVNEQ